MSEWVSEVAQSCPTLCDSIDYSLPGSSVHGIFQARVGCHCLLPKPIYNVLIITMEVLTTIDSHIKLWNISWYIQLFGFPWINIYLFYFFYY